jgi:hypothetical protein
MVSFPAAPSRSSATTSGPSASSDSSDLRAAIRRPASCPDADCRVHRANGTRALADRRGYTLHRAVTYVAHGEDAGHVCLEGERSTSQCVFETRWSAFQLAYFVGTAMWTYLTQPFTFAMPGFQTSELEPWDEAGQHWRRLHLVWPSYLATHCLDRSQRDRVHVTEGAELRSSAKLRSASRRRAVTRFVLRSRAWRSGGLPTAPTG